MRVVVIIPTLAADDALDACLAALERQSLPDFEIIVVDNSAGERIQRPGIRILRAKQNLGFGAAINWGARESRAPYIAVINDDAVAEPDWLASLLASMESSEDVGMCASCVIQSGAGRIDSAGMLLSPDGSTKQRGQGEPPENYGAPEESFFPSGSAALYRRSMFEQIGGFDESFFLYCEDSDLGLRARWAGWRCLYVPRARVQHRYSHSAGRASALKAYYVERNRLFLAVKNLPASMLALAPYYTVVRYWFHVSTSTGASAEFRRTGSAWQLAWFAVKAHWAALRRLMVLIRQRREIRERARISARDFTALARRFAISPREVAAR